MQIFPDRVIDILFGGRQDACIGLTFLICSQGSGICTNPQLKFTFYFDCSGLK